LKIRSNLLLKPTNYVDECATIENKSQSLVAIPNKFVSKEYSRHRWLLKIDNGPFLPKEASSADNRHTISAIKLVVNEKRKRPVCSFDFIN